MLEESRKVHSLDLIWYIHCTCTMYVPDVCSNEKIWEHVFLDVQCILLPVQLVGNVPTLTILNTIHAAFTCGFGFGTETLVQWLFQHGMN